MADVFISHRSTEVGKRIAARLRERLSHRRRIDSFLDAQNIPPGEKYTDTILDEISQARVVVVLFESGASSWVHLEAACAFFDAKLIPVALDGATVPEPYNQIQHESLSTAEKDIVDRLLDKVVIEVERRLWGATAGSRVAAAQAAFNRSFGWGWWAFLAIPGTWALSLGLSAIGWISHLHVVLGALFLGGLFFLALSFANALSAPSYRAREAGFLVVDRGFQTWAVLSILQPTVGLYVWFAQNGGAMVPGWLFLSLCAYASSLAFALAGYVLIRSTRADDSRWKAGRTSLHRVFAAYVLIICAFVCGVWVIDIMVCQCLPGWL